jgi:hypothetical protein
MDEAWAAVGCPMMRVEFSGSKVYKRDAPDLIRVEREKMVRAREIGEQTGLFYVPEVIDYDEAAGLIVMENIPGIVGVRNARLAIPARCQLFARIGEGLSEVHRRLTLPASMRVMLPEKFCDSDEIFMHGDFSGENVCVSVDDVRMPVVLDWHTTALCGGRATVGSRHFDQSLFIANIFKRPLIGLPGLNEARDLVEAFLGGYALRAQGEFDYVKFVAYHRRFFETRTLDRRSEMHWAKRVLLARGHRLWRRVIEAL